jgi:CxxC motif-containing protein
MGCEATVTIEGGRAVRAEGLECSRGKDYVAKEVEAPMRDFFSTVSIEGGVAPVCPVRSTRPIPKDRIMDCSRELAELTIAAPVRIGDIVTHNILGLGVDLVATRSVEALRDTGSE